MARPIQPGTSSQNHRARHDPTMLRPRFGLLVVACVALAACGATGSGSGAAGADSGKGSAGAAPASRTTTSAAPVSATSTVPVLRSQRAEASLPAAVQESAAAATDTKLYVVGGYNSAAQSVSSVFVYNGSQWANGPTFPIAVNHPAAAVFNGDVYVAGGFTSGSATKRVFKLANGATSWKEVAAMHTGRAAAALVPVGRYLYAIGGLAGSTQIAQVERYDPATDAWTDLIAMPHPRNHVAGYLDGDFVCVAGGREPTTSGAVDCLDTMTTTWRAGHSLQIPTSGAAAGIVEGALIVVGGESAGETALVPLLQEGHGGAWSTEPMLDPRHGVGYAPYQGRFWMCGGGTAPGYHASATCTSIGK